jgi:hypothetical protein
MRPSGTWAPRSAVVLCVAFLAAISACVEARPSTVPTPSVADPSPPAASFRVERPESAPRAYAHVVRPRRRLVDLYAAPGRAEPRAAFDVENPWGQRAPLLVEDRRRDADGRRWLRVQLPIGAGRSGTWVRADQVRVVPRDELIVVDLSARRLRHFVAGEVVHVFDVGIGRADAPSARGRFTVWARVPQPDGGPYGTFVLGLSGMAPISEWTGEGRMAIHGTADPSDRGRRVSDGCIRAFDPQMERLTGVPLGTPVVIRA